MTDKQQEQLDRLSDLEERATRLVCEADRLMNCARSIYEAIFELREEIYGTPYGGPRV
ncbi:hypothetical protein GCM10025859_01240 [Alicyclobacillus fastidiosus]|nr:hypothetical protein GCM10025859_01240 [Alicyclobacillus fastidiosus]